jgi:flagellar biogenesis protein FliO
MWQMLSAALVVLVIGAVALFVLKKLLPRIRSAPSRQIAVLETVYLGSRKAVHLLQVGSVKLLVASSPEGVVRLDDVTRAFPSEYSEIAMRAGAQAEADQQDGDLPKAG